MNHASEHTASYYAATANWAGDSARFDVFERVRQLKLPGGKWFANPALALGMLNFRLKEALGVTT